MKLILENWQKFVNEAEGQGTSSSDDKEQKVEEFVKELEDIAANLKDAKITPELVANAKKILQRIKNQEEKTPDVMGKVKEQEIYKQVVPALQKIVNKPQPSPDLFKQLFKTEKIEDYLKVYAAIVKKLGQNEKTKQSIDMINKITNLKDNEVLDDKEHRIY